MLYAIPVFCALADLAFAMVAMGSYCYDLDTIKNESNSSRSIFLPPQVFRRTGLWFSVRAMQVGLCNRLLNIVLRSTSRIVFIFTDWLSQMNSMMTQIDLASKSMAPALTGLLFDYFRYVTNNHTSPVINQYMFCSYGTSAVLLMFLNALITVLFFWFLSVIYHAVPALWSRHTLPTPAEARARASIQTDAESGQDTVSGNPFAEAHDNNDGGVKEGSKLDVSENVDFEEAPSTLSSSVGDTATSVNFLSSGCAGTMFSYSMLYFTVLSFSSLMTVYLK